MGRILAIDPGEAHIGIALSDPSGVVARPLKVLHHTSRERDVQSLLETAAEHAVDRIVIGVAYGPQGEAGPQARKALRLAEALRGATQVPIVTWDESGSSRAAGRRQGPDLMEHARAAAVILQEHLDASAQ
jgi:putative Holliday junction resolvase